MKRDHAQDHPQKQRTVIKRLALVISYFFKNNSQKYKLKTWMNCFQGNVLDH